VDGLTASGELSGGRWKEAATGKTGAGEIAGRRLARGPSACARKAMIISRSALGLRFERDTRLLPALHERMGRRRGVDSVTPIGAALSKIISAASCLPSPQRIARSLVANRSLACQAEHFSCRKEMRMFPVSYSLICRRIGHAPRSTTLRKHSQQRKGRPCCVASFQCSREAPFRLCGFARTT